jgi:hypothetical protein
VSKNGVPIIQAPLLKFLSCKEMAPMAPPKGVSECFFRSGRWTKEAQGVALKTQGVALETQGVALGTQGVATGLVCCGLSGPMAKNA